MKAPVVPILIGDLWTEPQVSHFTAVHQPSSGEVIARTPMCGSMDVELAVVAGSDAYPDWSRLPAPERGRVLFRSRELLEDHFEELAQLVCRENGKTLEEARGDVRRGIEVVEFAAGIVWFATTAPLLPTFGGRYASPIMPWGE